MSITYSLYRHEGFSQYYKIVKYENTLFRSGTAWTPLAHLLNARLSSLADVIPESGLVLTTDKEITPEYFPEVFI